VLCSNVRRTDSEVARLKYGLIAFKEFERWKQLTDDAGRPFQSWEDYLQYPEPNGLGISAASAKLVINELDDTRLLGDVLAADAKDRANLRPRGRPKENAGNNNNVAGNYTGYPEKGTRAEALRRLRKPAEADPPDAKIAAIYARVLAGEITPHAGMIEAGFRKKRVRKKLTRVERGLNRFAAYTKIEQRDFLRRVFDRFPFLKSSR
jgi:hypothetical protein